MSSSGSIGNLSHVDRAGSEEVERQEESRSHETVPTVTVSGEDHDENALQGLESVYPEAHRNAESERSILRLPAEIASRIAQSADPATRGGMRGSSRGLRQAANATVRKVTLNGPEGANGGSAISQAGSAFKSAKDVTLKGVGFGNEHAKEIASSFQAVRSVTLDSTPGMTGGAFTELPQNLRRLSLFQGVKQMQDDLVPQGPHVQDEHLASLAPDLKTFIADGIEITDAGLKDLPRGITSIGLVSNQITDAGIKDLPPNLKRLFIQSEAITDAAIEDLPKGIEQLDLISPFVTGAAIADIPESVHTLGLLYSFEGMNEGLERLSKNVHTLTLSGDSGETENGEIENDVSDESIATLPETVRTIHLVGEFPVSAERLQKLREQNPDRKITSESFEEYQEKLTVALRGEGDQGFV